MDLGGRRTGHCGRRANLSTVRGSGVSSGTRPGHAATVRASGFPPWPPGHLLPRDGHSSRFGQLRRLRDSDGFATLPEDLRERIREIIADAAR